VQIEIERPQEEYDITLNFVKLEFNKELTEDQFALEQPPGAEVVRLGEQNNAQHSMNGGDPK
jgi:outer membrane lipoprotein-sorting protein